MPTSATYYVSFQLQPCAWGSHADKQKGIGIYIRRSIGTCINAIVFVTRTDKLQKTTMATDKQANAEGGFDKELAELLHSIEYPSNYQFSPNGDRIVYQSGIDFIKDKRFVSTLWLATTEAGSARKLTTGRYRDSNPQWHPDGERIVFSSDRANPGTHAIWMMPLSGGDAQPVSSLDRKKSTGAFKLSPDGKTIAFLSEDEPKKDGDGDGSIAQVWGEKWTHTRLFILNVESGEARAVSPEDRTVTGLSWHPDSKSIAYSSVENTEEGEDAISGTQFHVCELDSGNNRDICNVRSEISRLSLMADGKLYFIAPYELRLLKASRAVWSVDTNATGASPVREAFGETDTPVDIQVAGGKIYVGRLDGTGKAISDLAGNDVFRNDGANRPVTTWNIAIDPKTQEPVLAATLSDPSTPWEAFIIKHGGKEETKLSNLGEKAVGKINAKTQVFTCRSSDDKEDITGIFLSPAASQGKAVPTLVMPHGGPTDNDIPSFDANLLRWTPYLISKGYGILLPQYRGSTAYGQRFAAWTSEGIGSFDYEDVISVTDHAVKAGLADPKRLMVGYCSQGGYLSFLCAVRNGLHDLGWKFNAAIAGAGFVDIDGLILGSDTGFTDQLELAAFKAPWELDKDDTTARKGSAIWEMKHAVEEAKRRGEMVIPPVLIMHGDQDDRTPYWQAVAFRKAMRWYGLPFEFVTYPGQPHLPMKVAHQLDIMERVSRWCDKYMGKEAVDGGAAKTQAS